MKKLLQYLMFALVFVVLLLVGVAEGAGIGTVPSGFQRWALPVDGVTREAIVYAPPTAKTSSTPVVFVFHGHGGTARSAALSFALQRHWPEAIVVYMQGLNTPGRLTDPEGKKPGWQPALGDQGDRDLKFFDAVLSRLKQEYTVDTKRVYATGHSNGGAFTYLLWAERGEVLAAVAPSAAVATLRSLAKLNPKPTLHVAGENDPLVRFAWQRLTMAGVRKLNGCAMEGKPWAKDCTLYPSTNGAPFVAFVHRGDHKFPGEAPALIARFFKEQPGTK